MLSSLNPPWGNSDLHYLIALRCDLDLHVSYQLSVVHVSTFSLEFLSRSCLWPCDELWPPEPSAEGLQYWLWCCEGCSGLMPGDRPLSCNKWWAQFKSLSLYSTFWNKAKQTVAKLYLSNNFERICLLFFVIHLSQKQKLEIISEFQNLQE